jgi:tetratricopeptide (TPR) repeat protein
MVVDASERLQTLERKFPGHPQIAKRRARLDGGPGEDARPALSDILSEDFESVLDAELGRALTDQMAKGAEEPAPPEAPEAPPGAPVLTDESALFSDEQEFFNFAGELQSEMRQEAAPPEASVDASGREIPLEEIFREFKKGVEQQLSPEDYETHYNLGIAYKEMSLTDEAISEFQRAAKSPQYAVECCSMLGLCFLEKGMPQLAIKWYKKGLEAPNISDDDRLGLQYDLASVYAGLGDRDNAYKTFLEIYGANASFRDVGERLKELSPA